MSYNEYADYNTDPLGRVRFYGTYRATVKNNVDYENKKRLSLIVPQVSGSDTIDLVDPAVSSGAIDSVTVPEIGETAWVIFESGDPSYPLWMSGSGFASQGIQGPAGANGATGATGPTGATGATGASFTPMVSSSSVFAATGTRTFAVTNTYGYTIGQRVRAYNVTLDVFCEGPITALTTNSSVTIVADYGNGSTFTPSTSWTIALAGELGLSYNVTSSTSATITGASFTTTYAGGSNGFFISAKNAFIVGSSIRFISTVDPTVFIQGRITSITSSGYFITLEELNGSGTYSSWRTSIGGSKGTAGTTGATGATGPAGTIDNLQTIIDTIDAKASTALTNANAGTAAANAADAKASTALTNAATNYSQLSSSISSLSTVASSATAAATAAQTTAEGKNKIFRQGTTPTASSAGDLWFDSSADNKLSKWSGTAWEPFGLGNAAISNLDAGKISTGYLAADRIDANTITASKIAAGAIVADKLATNALYGKNIYGANISTVADGGTTVSRVVLDTTGLYAFNGTTPTFSLSATDGSVKAENGSWVAGTITAANISARTLTPSSTLNITSATSTQISDINYVTYAVSNSFGVVSVGKVVTISGVTPTEFNKTYVVTATTTTSFTVVVATSGTVSLSSAKASVYSDPGVIMDYNGLYAFNSSGKRTFGLEASTGNVAMENATLIAANISAQTFVTGTNGARIEMSDSPNTGSWSDAISFYASTSASNPAKIYAAPTDLFGDNRLVIQSPGSTPSNFSIRGASSSNLYGTGTGSRFEFNLITGTMPDLAIGPTINTSGGSSGTTSGLLRSSHSNTQDNTYLIACDQGTYNNGTLVSGQNNTYVSAGDSGSLYLRGGKNQTSNQIEIPTNTVSGVKFSGNIYPDTDSSGSIGNNSLTWNDIYVVHSVNVSDVRTKKDIEPIAGTPYGLDFINSLRPVLYKRTGVDKDPVLDKNGVQKEDEKGRVWTNRDGVRNHTGFIAQEVQSLLSETEMDWAGWVVGDVDDPESKQALRYTEFIAPLTAAIQELSAKLEAATEKINNLESRLNNGNS